MYKFNDYSGLMTKDYKAMPTTEDGIVRNFREEVEIVEEGLKIPHWLPGLGEEPTYYLDTMIRVNGKIFFTCKKFLTKCETSLVKGMKLSWDKFEGTVIQTGYYPVTFSLLITKGNCEHQIWGSLAIEDGTTIEGLSQGEISEFKIIK